MVIQQIFPADFTITVKVDAAPNTIAFEDTKPVTLTPKSGRNNIKVASTSPTAGATNVSTNQGIISIKFDKELASDNDWASFTNLTSPNCIVPITATYADKTLSIKYNGLTPATGFPTVLGF